MGDVLFDGQGPFALPVAQSATARSAGNTVEVVFRLLSDPSRLDDVSIAMMPNQATTLLAHLSEAIDRALQWERSQNPHKA